MPLPNRSTATQYDAVNKINNQLLPPANQSLDWQNPALASAVNDVVALGLTGCRFFCRLTLASSSGGLLLPVWWAVWANITQTTPVIARTTTGVFTITLPTVVSNEYQASLGITNNETLNLLAAAGSLEGSTFGFINASASGNVITINTANSAGSANDLANVTCLIVSR